MKFKGIITLFAVILAGFLSGKETLNIDFTKAKEISVAGKTIQIDEAKSERGIFTGGDYGVSFPAASFLGDNQGTVLFRCSFDEPRGKTNITRPVVQLRTGSRLTVGFHNFSNSTLVFSFTDRAKSYNVFFNKKYQMKIQPGREYMLGFTWDGMKVRVYLDGIAVDEAEQPLTLKNKVRNLNIGPYKDSWLHPKPWADDMHIKSLQLFDTALSPQEIAELNNVKLEPLAKTHPMKLTVPMIQQKLTQPPVLDGKLNDGAWEHAASMPRLIQGNFPRESGTLPPHDFKMLYDDENLYIGFTTLFPAHVPIQEGDLRSADIEPEVWGTESFEFYFENDKGQVFRFGGNVAGGYCETHSGTAKWNGKWTYKTTREMKIDDTILWQGEVAIPWKTVNCDKAPSKPIKFNFCRSWKLPDFGNHSSLNLTGGSYNKEGMITGEFAQRATFQMLKQNNPNTGEYTQDFRIAAPNNGNITYELAIGKLDGSVRPMPLFKRTYNMKAGDFITGNSKHPIVLPDYDCLVYTLTDGKDLSMREIVPMKLDDNFFDIVPLFLQNKIAIKLKDAVMRSKLGPGFAGTIRLLNKDGKVLSQIPTNSANLELTFNRDWAAGEYVVGIFDQDGKACAQKNTSYPGYGEWEKFQFPKDVILPPFTAMENNMTTNGFSSSLACRKYTWDNGFLPAQIESQQENLFAAPAVVLINGKPAAISNFNTDSAAGHRVDFRASGAEVRSNSWLEYDGVQWNEMTVTPAAASTLSLQFTLDARFAKYLHAASSASWGAKLTRKVEDGDTTLKYFPILWLGNEEKGFCFFAETREGWTVPAQRTYKIEKKDGKAVVTVNIAEKMQAGKPFSFSFGLLGTPMRPLAKNYPFDTLGFGYTDALNRPGRRPTTDVSYMCHVPGFYNGDLGSFFGDIDDNDGCARAAAHKRTLEVIDDSYNVRPVPYLCARYLSIKYPEMAAYKTEWTIRPEIAMDYTNTGHFVYDCCPTTSASSFFAYKVYQMLKRNPKMKGVYFDFGNVPVCSNDNHGCTNRLPILAMREFYRKIAYVQICAGIKEPVTVVHNTDCNMYPTYTFTTHLLNGEQVRQASSSLLHNKKDILDSYGIEMFAAELSTLPLGVTNSVYMPMDTLLPKYGGDEKFGPYQFRMGKAEFAATLIHNTIICLWRNHYGLFDKLIRIYDRFGVANGAEFIGYWKEPAKVTGAENIYVSCFANGDKVLAIVGHVGKEHKNQTFDIKFDWNKLKVKNPPKKATDTMTAPDEEYKVLQERLVKYNVPRGRAPLELGDFGSKVISFDGNVLKMSLDFHCFAIVELN